MMYITINSEHISSINITKNPVGLGIIKKISRAIKTIPKIGTIHARYKFFILLIIYAHIKVWKVPTIISTDPTVLAMFEIKHPTVIAKIYSELKKGSIAKISDYLNWIGP